MTGADHQHSAAVEEAAQWMAEQSPPPSPAVPILKRMFGLDAKQACEAIALADRFRSKGRAFG